MTELKVAGPAHVAAAAADPAGAPGGTGWRRALGFPLRQPTLTVSAAVVLLVLLWAIVPQAFTWLDPLAPDNSAILQPPSLEHPFGTDRLGRDVYTRTVHGSAITLSSTLLAVLIGFVSGTALGLVAGSAGGWTDRILGRVIDTLLAVPGLLVTLVVVAALGYSTANVAIAVGLSAIASFARVMRAETLKVAGLPFIESSRALGAPRGVILLRHLLPNAAHSVLSLVPLQFGAAILSISALGFLGFGAPPPQPEWGQSVAEGRDLLATSPWIALLPGLVIAAVVLSSNRISRALTRSQGES